MKTATLALSPPVSAARAQSVLGRVEHRTVCPPRAPPTGWWLPDGTDRRKDWSPTDEVVVSKRPKTSPWSRASRPAQGRGHDRTKAAAWANTRRKPAQAGQHRQRQVKTWLTMASHFCRNGASSGANLPSRVNQPASLRMEASASCVCTRQRGGESRLAAVRF